MVKLEIFSDPICPWCYIGKARLDRALAEQPDHPFQISWFPFQLNPEMPSEGMDRRSYLEAKFGGKVNAVKFYSEVAEVAEEEGLFMNLTAIERTPNTLDAHRLIFWAGLEERQEEVVDALFKAYFVEGRDIGRKDVLADIADSAGLDAAAIQRLLKSDADKDEVRKADAAAREMGVSAVPTFIVAGAHAVPGVQPTELWQQVLAELADAPPARSVN